MKNLRIIFWQKLQSTSYLKPKNGKKAWIVINTFKLLPNTSLKKKLTPISSIKFKQNPNLSILFWIVLSPNKLRS